MQNDIYDQSDIEQLIIIDGQQRITTITLLLLALKKVAENRGDNNIVDGITMHYLTNPTAGEHYKLKLRQSDVNQRALVQLMFDSSMDVPDIPNTNVDENLKFFIKNVEENDFDIIYKGIKRLMFVKVALERGKDDPQMIFETMNSTGLDLSESDKIRNFILMGLEKNDQDNLFTTYWDPIEENSKHSKKKTDDFIRSFLTMKQGA